MELTPTHLQVAGIAVIVLLALGFMVWVVRAVIAVRRGNPMYVLPDSSHDDEEGHDDNGDGDDRPTEIHFHPK